MLACASSVPAPNEDEAALALVVICLSAGGLQPLRTLLRGLPGDFPGAVVVAQHISGCSILPEILRRDTALPVAFALPGARVAPGNVYVCPPARHIMIAPDATIGLSDRERIPYRPSGDWLFESAAASFGEQAIAVVLSGMQRDGARGALHVHARGGKVVAQAPDTCERPEMPRAVIATGVVDCIAEPEALSQAIVKLVARLDRDRCRQLWDVPFQLVPVPSS